MCADIKLTIHGPLSSYCPLIVAVSGLLLLHGIRRPKTLASWWFLWLVIGFQWIITSHRGNRMNYGFKWENHWPWNVCARGFILEPVPSANNNRSATSGPLMTNCTSFTDSSQHRFQNWLLLGHQPLPLTWFHLELEVGGLWRTLSYPR